MQGQPQDLRGLKLLVGVLGGLIVLGTALVVGVVIHRIYAGPQAASTPASLPAVAVAGPTIFAAGSHITALVAAGGQFAVTVTGPAGDQLWLVNPQTGARGMAMSAPK